MTNQKKHYLCLHPLELSSPLPINKPKSMKAILGIFSNKKEALKYGKDIIEVEMKIKD